MEGVEMFHHRRHSPEGLRRLRQLTPFVKCSTKELARIDQLTTLVRLAPGRRLAVEGAVGRECFLVAEGILGLSTYGGVLDEARPGNLVGAETLIAGARHWATVTAPTEASVYVFSSAEFATLMDSVPAVALWVFDEMVMRAPAFGIKSPREFAPLLAEAPTAAPRILRSTRQCWIALDHDGAHAKPRPIGQLLPVGVSSRGA